MSRGRFIAFDGIDGSGKGTLIELLRKEVANYTGVEPILNKEPGGTPLGNKCRDILFVDPTTHRMCDDAIELVFFASFVQGLNEIILPALSEGKVVISDRWIPSQQGYQRARGNADPRIQDLYTDFGKENDVADVLFLLYGDPEVFLERAKARVNETHQAGKKWSSVEQLEEIQHFYLDTFAHKSKTIAVDTTDVDPRHIHSTIVWPRVKAMLDEMNGGSK